jgi:hypothetical protein
VVLLEGRNFSSSNFVFHLLILIGLSFILLKVAKDTFVKTGYVYGREFENTELAMKV